MNTTLSQTANCPNCGKPLPASAPAGLCPACLLAQGMDTDPGGKPGRFQPPPVEEIARLFPQLEILGLLGAGGMGAVYKARQPALARFVALKVLPPQDSGGADSAERFNREARALARLSHPNIVAVHEFGLARAGGLQPPSAAPAANAPHGDFKSPAQSQPETAFPYFIMEFVDGANLRQLGRAARLSPREALQIIPQICDALQYAHDEGVVHRDIKPENVLVDRRGRVKIADFGLAKIFGTDGEALRLTAEGQVMGTPHYMAPEQVERPLSVDHRADIYSLGVVFYELLTGDLPLGKFAPPSRKVSVDVRLDDVVLRALENDPARRYQRVSEVKTQMETITSQPAAPGSSRREEAQTSTAAPQRRLLHWAGFPVVTEFGDEREVNWNGTLSALAAAFFCLFLGFVAVRLVTGQANIPGTSPVCAAMAVLTVMAGVRRTLNQPWESELPRTTEGTVILPPKFQRHRGRFALLAIPAFVVAWSLFVLHWLEPRLRLSGGVQSVVAQVATRLMGTGELVAKLPGGGRVELLAVSGQAAGPGGWWLPDGRPLSGTTFAVGDLTHVRGASGTTNLDFIFRLAELPAGASAAYFEFEHSELNGGGGVVLRDGTRLEGAWPMRAAFPKRTTTTTARVGMGLGEWQTIASHAPARQASSRMKQASHPAWELSFEHGSDRDGNAQVTVVFGPEHKPWQTRVVAVDQAGGTRPWADWLSHAEKASQSRTYTFRGLPLSGVKEFQMQVRPVHVVELRDIALRPSKGWLAFNATPRLVVAKADPATGILRADVPGRGVIELLGVAETNAAPNQWWRPDGRVATNANYELHNLVESSRDSGHFRVFVFRTHDLPDGADGPFLATTEPGAMMSSGGTVFSHGKPLSGGRPMVLALREPRRFTAIRAGLAIEARRPVFSYDPATRRTQHVPQSGDPHWDITLHGATDTPNGAQVTSVMPRVSTDWQVQLIAVDQTGKERTHRMASGAGTPSGGDLLWTYNFPGLPLKDVKEFRVVARRVQWFEFPDVALEPKGKLPEAKPLRLGAAQEITFNELLDLDTALPQSFPPGLAKGSDRQSAEMRRWAGERGFDLAAGVGELLVMITEFALLKDEDWDRFGPMQVIDSVYKGRFAPTTLKRNAARQIEQGLRPESPGKTAASTASGAARRTRDTEVILELKYGDTELGVLLNSLALQAELNLVLDPNLNEISRRTDGIPIAKSIVPAFRLTNVTARQALETVLIQNNLQMTFDSKASTYHVTPQPLRSNLSPAAGTFSYETRDGGFGLLQIVGFGEGGFGATIRIKRVER
jgi:serine/threonine protein kinase